MDSVRDDTLKVIETIKDTEEYNQVLGEYQEVKKNFDSINERLEEISKRIEEISDEQEVFKGLSEEQEVFEETSEGQEVFEETLIEIQKFNFGFSVLNCVLLVCIIFSIWLSKLEV